MSQPALSAVECIYPEVPDSVAAICAAARRHCGETGRTKDLTYARLRARLSKLALPPAAYETAVRRLCAELHY